MKKITKVLLTIFFLICLVTPIIYSKYTSRYDKTITLNVAKPVYTVVFHSNFDNDITTTQNFVYGTSQTLTTNTFSRSQYVFMGWNTEANGTGTHYDDEQSVNRLSSINNDSIDLYAQWRQELTFTVTGNPTNWTNQDVTLTIVPAIADTYMYSFDGGNTWQSSPSKTFSSNQTVNMKIKTLDDFTSNQVSETINKIDKIDPSINISSNPFIVTLDESNSVSAIATTSDNESGIDATGLQVYRYVVATSTKTDLITDTNYFEEPGLYAVTLEVSDEAGNTTSINSQILVRWPTGGRYVVSKTEIDGAKVVGVGHSSSTSQDGLYEDDANTGYNDNIPFSSKYYYAGATVDNYLSFAGNTFRILNIATNDDIKVLGDISDLRVSWGNKKIYDSNIYNAWSTVWWINGQIYNNDSGESKYKLFTTTQKSHVDLATFYAGRLASNSDNIATIINNEQNDTTDLGGNGSSSFQGYSAYPNVSDFLKASKAHDIISSLNDILVTATTSKKNTFNNNSWIDMTTEYWTMNGRKGTLLQNDNFWVIDNDIAGHFEAREYWNAQQYRVVFYIKDNTILSGSGTQLDPYTVEEDWTWFDNVQILQ